MPKKLTTESFIERARSTHGDVYDYSLVRYVKSRIKVIIKCPKHGNFDQTPSNHLFGQGCPFCGKNVKRHSYDTFLQKAREKHGDKYDYSLVLYRNSYIKVNILCKKHGIFKQAPSQHLYGSGCRRCHDETVLLGIDNFIKKAIDIHGDLYDYSKTIYKNARTNVNIFCRIHGIFSQNPNSHLSGRGCKKCYYDSKYSSKDEFIEKAKAVHGNKYDYSLVKYLHARKSVRIICRDHGVFNQTPNNHLRGQSCKKCKSSKGEGEILDILMNKKISFEVQKKFKTCKSSKNRCLKFDFYIKSHNLLIEYDGEQHYKPINLFGGRSRFLELRKNDLIKNNWCLDNGITLLRIPYTSFDKIEQILEKYLKK